ncbi:hypothetical protein [Natronosalvus amylolyticus]|uniref:hypothetical protein n=1 Tax=Natronosalvus amylolyticus TaxID=2961994 RepID=UPI0020C99235|nr:hypothetical protein [Natronosalvus amylolyticus]
MTDVESRIPDMADDRVVEFCTLVEEGIGNRVSTVDPMMEDCLCWFALHAPLEFAGEEFDAEFEIELSENDVRLIVAEITCERPMEDDRREIIETSASLLDKMDDEFLFEYHPSAQEVEPILSQLEDIHSRVFA